MIVELVRIFNCSTYCIGKLYINGVYQNDTLEDTDRGLDQSMSEEEIKKIKVPSKTAIPTGTYEITMDIQSLKFAQYPYYKKLCNGYLPRLKNVKGFLGILMHCGKNAENSAGCLLQGLNTEKGKLTNSQAVFTKLMTNHFLPAKKSREKMTIKITRRYKVK